jgi:hypothetical protein
MAQLLKKIEGEFLTMKQNNWLKSCIGRNTRPRFY